MPVRPLERGHHRVPRRSGFYRVANEQGWRISSLRTLGFQAHQDKDRSTDCNHHSRSAHLHRRLFQLPHRRFGDASDNRAPWRDKRKTCLPYRLHRSSGLHHIAHIKLGGSRVGIRVGRREWSGVVLPGYTVQFLRILHNHLHIHDCVVRIRLQGNEQVRRTSAGVVRAHWRSGGRGD